MALARVVEFDGVTKDRVDQMRQEMEGSAPPEGLPVKELIVLHDADAEKAVVVVFFDSEEDYRQGNEALNAMPTEDTPGKRSSVKKYDVVHRQTV
jgi:heme-degrading monooxygenase HmoA